MSNTSRYLAFEGIVNSRDLGGMKTADNAVVRPGKLIRSGHLANATEEDVKILSGLIDTVADLRTETERQQNPDAAVPGVTSHHLSILEGRSMGPRRDEQSDMENKPRRRIQTDREEVARNFSNLYRGFITS